MKTNPFFLKVSTLLIACWLISCNSGSKSESQEAATTSAPPASPTVTEPVAAKTAAAATSAAVLNSQNGPDGSVVDLTKAEVNGSILTVELQYKHGSKINSIGTYYDVDQVSVVDEASAKKYSVLKDQSGNYMASPVKADRGKEQIHINIPTFDKTRTVLAWFKFPAPPADTKTISVSIPEVGSFTGIPITR